MYTLGARAKGPTRPRRARAGSAPPALPLLVSLLALVACIGAGAWLAFTLPVPVLATSGAAIGAALGVVLVILVLHDGDGPARTRGTR